MRLTGTRAYYRSTPPKMPPGLVELMEGLTKEVLKHNPTDIYGFCAGHVQQLIEKRDGPSRLKLSVEEKITKAQQKVRQRAEKRRAEFDKKVLQEEKNNYINDELTLHVPQLIAASQSQTDTTVSGKDSSTSQQEVSVQNVLKSPIHHEHALESSSEVEITHESSPTMCTSTEFGNKNDCVDKNSSNEQNQTSTGTEKKCSAQSGSEVNENKATAVISLSEVPTIIEPANATADTSCENLVVNDQSNNNTSANIENNQEINKVDDSTTSIPDKDENGTNNIDKEEISDGVIDLIAKNSDNNANMTHEISKPSSNDTSNPVIKQENYQQPLADDCDDKDSSTSGLAVSNSADQTQFSDNELKPAEEHTALSNNIEKLQQVDHTQNLQTGDVHNPRSSSVIQESNSSDHNLENVESLNTNTHAQSNSNINNATKTIQASINAVITDSESNLEPADVDKDIQTLVTESTANDTNEISDLQNTVANDNGKASLEDLSSSQVNKENAVLDKVISDSEDAHDSTHLNPKNNNANINFSNVTHATEAHSEGISNGEQSQNMNENIQNDNHNPGNMDLETAAITIQKVFRNFLFKSRGSTFEDTGNDEGNFLDEDDKNKEDCDFPVVNALSLDRRAHGITRMDTVLQTVNEEKSLSLSDDSSTLSSAATVIQAHVRGFLVRNKLNSSKTVSTNSLPASNSNEPSNTSLEADKNHNNKNKTVLNIHIVPEGENYLSRDESLITSMELSLDSSPPSSINLHPLGYDKSERRKRLKREDAIQSISPPSNNSGKLSEDLDSVKELSLNYHDLDKVGDNNCIKDDSDNVNGNNKEDSSVVTALKMYEENGNNFKSKPSDPGKQLLQNETSMIKLSSDEMDVVTPFLSNEDSTLIHSGEFHDAVLPTRVSRSDTSVVSGE